MLDDALVYYLFAHHMHIDSNVDLEIAHARQESAHRPQVALFDYRYDSRFFHVRCLFHSSYLSITPSRTNIQQTYTYLFNFFIYTVY